MRKAAKQTAEAELANDRAQVSHDGAEIEGVWAKLAAMTRHLLPQGSAGQGAREQVAWVLARWRITKDREPQRGEPGQRDD